jgi:hypothetical protein
MDRQARIVAGEEQDMKDTGGHAFPHQLDIPNEDGINIRHRSRGMTLRDYFAAKTLMVVLAGFDKDAQRILQRENEPTAAVAKACYAMADAMLAERSKT